jgi:phosphoribosylamine--glycine ligase
MVGAEEVPGAHAALQNFTPPIVLKADGLAAGKGVVICDNANEATPFWILCSVARIW